MAEAAGRDALVLRLAVHNSLLTAAQAQAAQAAGDGAARGLVERGVLGPDDAEVLERLAARVAARGGADALPALADTADTPTFGPAPAVAPRAPASDLPPPASGLRPAAPRPFERVPAVAGKPMLGAYTLLGELGRGGMGVVYRARRGDLQRDFALKVILPGQQASAEIIARFQREARAAAGLAGHPGIVGVHDIGEDQGKHYFAMDLVEGPSLDALIDGAPAAAEASAGRPASDAAHLSPRRAAELVEQAAEAVHFAHTRGILHRDLKPANVLLDGDGKAWVTDFGLAASRAADAASARLTKSGAVLGTPAYMSPEQAGGGSLDVRADVYSLGATLYEALVGAPPFDGDTVYAVLARVLRDEPRPPRRRNPAVPRDLETITLKCLEKSPERRYATAQALAEDLRRWRTGDALAARPATRWERWRRQVRRNRAPWTVGAVLGGLLMAVAAGFGLIQLRQQAARAAEQRGRLTTARELVASAPERAVELLDELARTGGPADEIAALRQAAEASRAELRVAAVRAQAAVPLRKAADARAEFDRLSRQLAGLPRAGGARGAPALGPEAGGLDPAAGAAADPGETDTAADAERDQGRQAREAQYVLAWSGYSTVVELLAGEPGLPEHAEAADALGELAWGRLREAEREGNAAEAARYEADLRRVAAERSTGHAASRYAAELDGAGTLTLDTTPSGARVECRRYREAPDGRLEDAPYDPAARAFVTEPVSLGQTPLRDVALPMGSYLLILRADGFRDTRYPVLIERGERETQRAAVPLYTDTQIGDGFVYVPPGWTVVGGDAQAYNAWPRENVWVERCCLAEREVTMGEYRDFLADRSRTGALTAQEVQAMVPRQAPASGPYWPVQAGAIGMNPAWAEWPVFAISWHDAQAYCKWLGEREGREIRLPTELEWARAARGADGRRFLWGERFDWRWCVGAKSPVHEAQNPQPKPVLAVPEDVSVFGVRDLAGSVREWCEDEPADGLGARALRGAAWSSAAARYFRTGLRIWLTPSYVSTSYGFRVRAAPRTN